jgi:uncharacterized protein YndB with AHSA1/START domain
MTVTAVRKDLDAHTMTIAAQFRAPIELVWQMWADPRKLERWWGPPVYPATFVEHDIAPGGRVTYYMTGPEGDRHHGWWRVIAAEAPHALEFEDGFADEAGNHNTEMPTTMARVTLRSEPDGTTTMEIASTFASRENMESLIEMGMEEGLSLAVGQIDGLLAALLPSS